MKAAHHLAAALLLLTIIGHPKSARAQGSLTPPGSPGPTMLTLQQIEPRIPISSLPITITNSGSYYFASNLTGSLNNNGITVSTNDVSIDLRGLELRGGAGSFAGIYMSGAYTNLVVLNGTIRNCGSYAIYASSGYACRFQGLQLINNNNAGIFGGTGFVVKECIVQGNNFYGISVGNNCTISDCAAYGNTNGIGAGGGSTITGCSSTGNTNIGIYAGTGTTVQSCSVKGNGGPGIETQDACVISGCAVNQNGSYGIYVANGPSAGGTTVSGCSVNANLANGIYVVSSWNRIVDNVCSYNGTNGSTSSAGIRVDGGGNRIEGNTLAGNNNRGLKTTVAGNFIVRNTATGNTVNYDTTGTQTIGQDIITTGTITTNNPWANFEY